MEGSGYACSGLWIVAGCVMGDLDDRYDHYLPGAEDTSRIYNESEPRDIFIHESLCIGFGNNELGTWRRPTINEQNNLRLVKERFEKLGYKFDVGVKGARGRHLGIRLRYMSQRELRDEVDEEGGN